MNRRLSSPPRRCLPAFAYSSLRCKAAAQAAYRRSRRLRAGLSAGPYFAGMQGRVPRGSPHSERPRLCLPACLYSSLRCEAAAQAAYRRARQLQAGLSAGPYLARVQGCVHVTHAARQARGGLGLASRLARNALRWESRPRWSARPRTTRLAKLGAA